MASWKNNKMVGVAAAVVTVLAIVFVVLQVTKGANKRAKQNAEAEKLKHIDQREAVPRS